MGRHGERGHAALWVIGSLAVSITVGVGVYLVIRDQRAAAAEAARNAPPEPEAEPAPAPRPEPAAVADPPGTPTEVPDVPAAPVDRAEADAVDPTSGMFGTPGIDGALAKENVVLVVRATEPKLTRCFTDNATTGGIVRVMMMLNRRGGVTTIEARGVDDALDRCIEIVLRSVRFARTTDGNPAKIVFPIAFHGPDGTDATTTPPTPTAGGDGACDEVACVIDNYEPPCCAKFTRGRPSAANTPEAPTRDDIVQAFRSLKEKVQTCASNAGFTGTLRLKLKFGPAGTVQEASVGDVDPIITACVARAARTLSLPASRNGAVATFPYVVP